MLKSLRFIVVAGLVMIGSIGMVACKGANGTSASSGEPYFALTLTSGSLFFGHIIKQDNQYITLKDVYYLQRTPPPAGSKKDEGPGLTLVKQENDPYGPKNQLIVNREHLLLYQELRDDSKVVEVIRQQEAVAAAAGAPKK